MFNSSRKKKDLASPCRRSHTDGSHGDGGTSPPPPVLKSSANASVHPVRSSPSEGRWRLRFGIHLVHERGMQSGSHGWQACPRGLRTNEGKGGHLQCQGKGRMWDVVQVEGNGQLVREMRRRWNVMELRDQGASAASPFEEKFNLKKKQRWRSERAASHEDPLGWGRGGSTQWLFQASIKMAC